MISDESTLDRPCAQNDDCTGPGEYCSMSYAYCRCLANHVNVNYKCLPGSSAAPRSLQIFSAMSSIPYISVIYPGMSGCVDSRQCDKAFPSATCTNDGVCQCPDNLQAKHQNCFPTRLFKGAKKVAKTSSSKECEIHTTLALCLAQKQDIWELFLTLRVNQRFRSKKSLKALQTQKSPTYGYILKLQILAIWDLRRSLVFRV